MNIARLAGLLGLLGLLGVAACGGTAHPARAGRADAQLATLADSFYAQHMAFRPTWAAQLGYHDFDGKLGDRSAGALAAEIDRLKAARAAFEALPAAELSRDGRLDREVVLGEIRESLFTLDALRSPWKDPMYYMDALDVSLYISRDYAPIATRARGLIGVAQEAGPWLATARANLEEALPRTFIDTALLQTNGAIEFVEGDVRTAMKAIDDPTLAAELDAALVTLVKELTTHREWLEARRAHATDDFALGEAEFLRMLAETQGLTIDLPRLREIADADLARNRAAMDEAAHALDPAHTTRETVLAEANDQPAADQVLAEATAQAAQVRQFLVDEEIVTIPSEDVAEVRESPPFMRWNLAFLDRPGAFETKPMPSFFYISPPDPKWPAEQQRAYLMPRADMLFVTVHEVWPGHFLHGLHVRKNGVRDLKTFCTYSTSEGWAHYVEEMMWDAGLGGGDPHIHIGQLKEALLRNVRFVAAIGLHTQGMTVDQATTLFEEQGYVDPMNARQQAVRGTFDPMYVSYTLGKLMIRKLRVDWLQRHPRASLKEFHDTFLSYGCAPVPVIRREMLGDDSAAL